MANCRYIEMSPLTSFQGRDIALPPPGERLFVGNAISTKRTTLIQETILEVLSIHMCLILFLIIFFEKFHIVYLILSNLEN